MKTKILLMVALLSAASLSAHAGIRFGFSIGLPLPVVVAAPAPVVVAPPVVYATAPAVVVGAGACPGPGYVWAPGYWSVNSYGRAWVGGGWRYHAAPAVYFHGGYGYGYGHGGWHR
jgi:hypothetical protein